MYQQTKKFLLKNSTAQQTVLKNTFWLFFGEIGGRLLKLAVIVYATRVLGVAGWGVFSYALASVSLVYLFADIGINTFITREMAKGGSDKYEYLSASLFLKLTLLVLSSVAALLIVPHTGNITLGIKIVVALSVLNFSDTFREFALSINRALERMEREALIKIILSIATAGLGIVFLIMHTNPLALAIAYAAGSVIASIATLIAVGSEFKRITWTVSWKNIGTILQFAWPFIAITIFSTAMANVDTIMLGQLKSSTEVGLYSAAERVVQFLAIIPLFIGMALFPQMAKSDSTTDAGTRMLEKTLVVIFAIGAPIAIGGLLFSTKLMSLIFGNAYGAGGIVLGILMISVLADFPNLILSNFIFINNLQKKFIMATLFGLLINILCNLLLIPRYGAIGASLAFVAAQFLILAINWQKLKRIFVFSILPKLGRVGLATLGMVAVILLCKMIGIYFILIILIAGVSYLGALWALKESLLSELFSIIRK